MQDSKIIEKLEAAKKQRDELVIEANRQIAMLIGKIQAYEELLQSEEELPREELSTEELSKNE